MKYKKRKNHQRLIRTKNNDVEMHAFKFLYTFTQFTDFFLLHFICVPIATKYNVVLYSSQYIIQIYYIILYINTDEFICVLVAQINIIVLTVC